MINLFPKQNKKRLFKQNVDFLQRVETRLF